MKGTKGEFKKKEVSNIPELLVEREEEEEIEED